MYAEPAEPTWAAVSSRPLPSSVRRPPMAPTIVTARPSRIQTVPSPITTIQCHLDQGNRSILAGIWVSMVRSATGSLGTTPPLWAVTRCREDGAVSVHITGVGRSKTALLHGLPADCEALLAAGSDHAQHLRYAPV